MLPVAFLRKPGYCEGKRPSLLSPYSEEPTAKRVAYQIPEEFISCSLDSEGDSATFEQQGHFPPSRAPLAASAGPRDISPEERQRGPLTTVTVCHSPAGIGLEPTSSAADQLNKLNSVRRARMEKTPHSGRTPEEVELALEVLNDELADASPLDRPSLELATQALMERLVEMRKRQVPEESPATSSGAKKQSTHEYSKSLKAVIVGDGTQKYTLIRIPMQDDMASDVYLVRGDPKAEYHYQTALDTLNDLQARKIMSDVTGGGRIDVRKAENKVQIYGYSYQYGAADHSITAKMMKEHFGDAFVVSFGNYGY